MGVQAIARRRLDPVRAEALRTAEWMGPLVARISGVPGPLTMTSAVRDQRYQDRLVATNIEATSQYSLHTTGYAFDVLRRNFARANPGDHEVMRWGWWFAGLSFLAGACWGVAGFMLASKDYELQRMLLGLVLLATITTAVPIRSAHPPTFVTVEVGLARLQERCC